MHTYMFTATVLIVSGNKIMTRLIKRGINKGAGSLWSHPYRVSHSAKILVMKQPVMKDHTVYETILVGYPVQRIWTWRGQGVGEAK